MASVVRERERELPVIAEVDVLVAGGGAAGLAAAVAAARRGARTMLVERYGSLGGLATNGLIILLLTLDDGRGRQVIGGICQELVARLAARNACLFPSPEEWGSPSDELVARYRRFGLVWGRGPHVVRYSVAYDPFEFKVEAEQMALEAGVDLRYHRWAVGVLREGPRITHVILESKAGREAVACRSVVDATGDADLVALAGEPFEMERVHPWLWFRTGSVRVEEAERSPERQRFYRTVHADSYLHPWGASERASRAIDATDPDELTAAEIECRRLVREELDRLRASVPGFERAYMAEVAALLGITESRRLLGRHVLRREEMDTPFPDTVAVTGHWTKYGAVYAIPYRALLPPTLENLLVAGRCISVDHRVHHATKEIPACFATGEAAGAACALALARGVPPAELDADELREDLRRRGAIIPTEFVAQARGGPSQ